MKKLFNFIILIFLFIITFAQSSFAQDYKITSVNFDTSNSIIFLTTQETIDEPILKSVKFVKMENPTRAYFDIDSSVHLSVILYFFLCMFLCIYYVTESKNKKQFF